MNTQPLALTLGDPAGIGPEIIVKAWSALRPDGPRFLVVGDAEALASAPGASAASIRRITHPAEAEAIFAEHLPVLDVPLRATVVAGRTSVDAAPAIVSWIETAVGLALSGRVSGIVTAPIAKAPLYAAGFGFPGHTEFLGELTAAAPYPGARGPVMMLATPELRVVLATTHLALCDVPRALTVEEIVRTGLVTNEALVRDFGVASPRIAVAALNPHAGEGGALGREEIDVIGPAIRALADAGVDASGPYPADSLFHAVARRSYDAALCLYHDQALIPIKMLDFWGGVNVTLGLPIIRTSPDHGTAFEIAGRGIARPDSLIAAVRLAGEMARLRPR